MPSKRNETEFQKARIFFCQINFRGFVSKLGPFSQKVSNSEIRWTTNLQGVKLAVSTTPIYWIYYNLCTHIYLVDWIHCVGITNSPHNMARKLGNHFEILRQSREAQQEHFTATNRVHKLLRPKSQTARTNDDKSLDELKHHYSHMFTHATRELRYRHPHPHPHPPKSTFIYIHIHIPKYITMHIPIHVHTYTCTHIDTRFFCSHVRGHIPMYHIHSRMIYSVYVYGYRICLHTYISTRCHLKCLSCTYYFYSVSCLCVCMYPCSCSDRLVSVSPCYPDAHAHESINTHACTHVRTCTQHTDFCHCPHE